MKHKLKICSSLHVYLFSLNGHYNGLCHGLRNLDLIFSEIAQMHWVFNFWCDYFQFFESNRRTCFSFLLKNLTFVLIFYLAHPGCPKCCQYAGTFSSENTDRRLWQIDKSTEKDTLYTYSLTFDLSDALLAGGNGLAIDRLEEDRVKSIRWLEDSSTLACAYRAKQTSS